MSKFCTSCGSELEDNAKFCPNCGVSLAVPTGFDSPVDNNAYTVQAETPVYTPQQEAPVYNPQPETPVYQQPSGFENYSDPYAQSQTMYNTPQQPLQPQKGPSKAMAIISMICGILSLLCCCYGVVAVVLGGAAIALAIISLVTKKGGKGMAITGIICGGIGFLGGLIFLISFWGIYSDAIEYGEFSDIFEDMLDSIGLGSIF